MAYETLGDIISRMNFLYSEYKTEIDNKDTDSPEYNEYQKYVNRLNEFEETSKRELAAMASKIARIDSQYQRTKSKPREY